MQLLRNHRTSWFGIVAALLCFGTIAHTAALSPPIEGRLRCARFEDKRGLSHQYVVFVPTGWHASIRRPIVLFLNGASENGEDGIKQISNNFGAQVWEMQRTFPFLAVAPQCRKSWSAADGADMRSANELLDHVIAEFGADPERVFVTGVSSGGNGAWLAASNYPDRFAAFVPLCGDGGGDPRRIGYAGIPVWIFNNELDNVNVVEYNRTMRKRLIELGHSPIVTEYHELGHDCWNRAYHSTAMYSWLLQQSRSRNQREKKFNYAPADKLVAEWRRIGDDGWTVGEDATLVFSGERSGVSRSVGAESPMPPGAVEDDSAPSNDRAKSGNNAIANALQGASDSNPVPFLVSPFQSRDLEIHVDVWLTAGADERIGLVQDDTAAGFFVSVVSPDAGTGGVVTEDGRWLARLDAAAQRMLRTDAWNDVRLKLAEGRLTVVLNGWPAVDIAIGDVDSERGKFRVAIAAPRNRLAGKWRYVRTRVL